MISDVRGSFPWSFTRNSLDSTAAVVSSHHRVERRCYLQLMVQQLICRIGEADSFNHPILDDRVRSSQDWLGWIADYKDISESVRGLGRTLQKLLGADELESSKEGDVCCLIISAALHVALFPR